MATETITLRLVAQDLMSGNVSKAIGKMDALAKRGGLVGSVMQGVGQSFGQMLNPAMLIGNAIGAVTQVMGESIQMASDQQESLSKVTVVFGEQSDAIKEWASGSAQAMGMTTTAALEAAGTLGNLFDALGISSDRAADMSKSITQLASDLASFNNADIQEVMGALQSGLVGETEPMRRFGANISAARVEAYALASGLVRTKKEITDNIKVQARYALIIKDTANAQGDFARTADGTANKQRILAASIENLETKVGTFLKAAGDQFLGFLGAVVDVIDGPNGVEKNLKDVADEIYRMGQVSQAAGVNIGPMQRMTDELNRWRDTLTLFEGNTDERTFDWLKRLGPDTLRNFGPANMDVAARIAAIGHAVQETGGDFSKFAAIIRQTIAPTFNVLTSAWTGLGSEVETTTTQIVKHAGRIRAVPFQMLQSLTDVKAEWKAGWKNLAEWAKHPFRPEAFEKWVNKKVEKALENANDPENSERTRKNWRKIANAMKSPILQALVDMGMSLDEAIAKIIEVQQLAKRVDKLGIVVTGAGLGNGDGGIYNVDKPSGRNNNRTSSGRELASTTVNVVHIGSLSERDGADLARTIDGHLQRHRGRTGR